MTALKKKAIDLIADIPDEQIEYIISFIETVKLNNSADSSISKSMAAFANLQKYRKKDTADIDVKEELAKIAEEKYESIN